MTESQDNLREQMLLEKQRDIITQQNEVIDQIEDELHHVSHTLDLEELYAAGLSSENKVLRDEITKLWGRCLLSYGVGIILGCSMTYLGIHILEGHKTCTAPMVGQAVTSTLTIPVKV